MTMSQSGPAFVSLRANASMVAKGTKFEQRALQILQQRCSMALDRIGGKDDGGIDLRGWWWLPPLHRVEDPAPALYSPHLVEPKDRLRIRVLAQCKAYSKKLGPSVIRELEGTLYQLHGGHHRAKQRSIRFEALAGDDIEGNETLSVGLIISQSSFSRQATLRAMSSPLPLFLVHLPEEHNSNTSTADTKETDDEAGKSSGNLGSAIWNPALGGPQGLLKGELDSRWMRSGQKDTGFPMLWWRGRPLENWVPALHSEESANIANASAGN